MTLIDALAEAYDHMHNSFPDKARLQRGKDMAIAFATGNTKEYTNISRDRKITSVWYVEKSDGTRYTVNLGRPYLLCNCPDVIDLGTISCKHVVACMLLSDALTRLDTAQQTAQDTAATQTRALTVRAEVQKAQACVAQMLLTLLQGGQYSGLSTTFAVAERQCTITVNLQPIRL